MGDSKVFPIRKPRFVAKVGGPIDETSVTLGIHGEALDPDEISALLKCSPTSSHRRGDPRRPNAPAWPSGAWLLRVEAKAPTEPEELLNALLGKVPNDPSIWSELNQGFTIQLGFGLFLDAWNRGFDLSPTVLERVTSIGASLGFDIYAGDCERDG